MSFGIFRSSISFLNLLYSTGCSEYVTLFYGKTDALEKIADIQKALEAIPDDKEDAGL